MDHDGPSGHRTKQLLVKVSKETAILLSKHTWAIGIPHNLFVLDHLALPET